MTAELIQTLDTATQYNQCYQEFSDQLEALEDTLLNFDEDRELGVEDPDLKMLLEVDLVSMEQKAQRLAEVVGEWVQQIREGYKLRPEKFS